MFNGLAPVFQKEDNAIHWINLYPVDNVIGFPNNYPLDSDISGEQCHLTFEQLAPGATGFLNLLILWIVIYPVDSAIQLLNK